MEQYNAIILGATGATGTAILLQLIEDEDFKRVLIFTRKDPLIQHKKLITHIVDFDQLENWKSKIKGDILFSAMGTTLKDAGNKENQYKVDFSYQLNFAKAAFDNNVKKLLLVSSVGANSRSYFFYPKIKGKLENAVKNLDFQQIYIFRPPVLIRQNEKMRSNEKILIIIFKALNKLKLLLSQKPMKVEILAKKMIAISKKETQQKQNTFLPKDIFN